MPPEINNQEAIQMMNRCKDEILSLRARIDRLQPKADAYDTLVTVVFLVVGIVVLTVVGIFTWLTE